MESVPEADAVRVGGGETVSDDEVDMDIEVDVVFVWVGVGGGDIVGDSETEAEIDVD